MTRHHKQKSPALARAFFSGLVGAAGLVTTIGIAQPARADTLADYLVQQVCDDGNGGHTSADPTTCPAAARKLRIGEALPYHKWDTASGAGQISDSYPVAELQGRTRVVHTFFFNDTSNFQNPEFDLADPITGRTGYDLSMTDGSYVSFAGTYDPDAGWQPLWRNSACSLSDSWVIGPKAQTLPLTYGDTTTSLNNRSPQCPPSSAYGSSYTGWNYYPDYLYESGKRLNTVKSWHFNGPSINADGIEQFYFTKEYGKTRWEAWSSKVSAPSANAVARCPTGVDNGVAVFGSTTYYLTDCHDWSFVKPAPKLQGDVAVIGHSLGGEHLVNLMTSANRPANITKLITVGSQISFFTACDSMADIRLGAPLPPEFPEWLNFYDRNDFLSYCAQRFFTGGNGVTDVEITSGVPFPDSHGAYWRQPALYARLAQFL